jgi:hypothetical protein
VQPCLVQCPLSALLNSEAVLSLLGWNLLSGGETALTRYVRTVTTHALARLLQAIITHCDGTVRRLCTVHGDTTRRLQIRQTYRGVSIPAPYVSGRPHLLTWAHPTQLPH